MSTTFFYSVRLLQILAVSAIFAHFCICGEDTDVSTLVNDENGGVCKDQHCVRVAKYMKKGLNESYDPCENFYEYACGGWKSAHKIPEKKEEYSAINELSDNNDKLLRQFLDGTYKGELCDKKHPADTDTIMKVKNFYTSCTNEALIEKRGSKPIRDFIAELGSWDIDDDNFNANAWDWKKTLQRVHAEYPAEIFFTIDVDVDPKNKKKNIITIDQAKLSMPQIEYFTNHKAEQELIEYATDIAMMTLEVDQDNKEDKREEIHKKMKAVFEFESNIAKIFIPKSAKRFTRVTLEKLNEATKKTKFNWTEHISTIFRGYEIEISKDTNVVVLSSDSYIEDILDLIQKTPKSTLSNYIMWKMVKDMVAFLNKDFTARNNKFRLDLTGVSHKKSRKEMCFKYTDEILGPLVGALFIRYAFCLADKQEVEEMMKLILDEFIKNVDHVGWVSDQTKKAIKKKAEAVVMKVGYPDYLFDEKVFKQRYDEIKIHDDKFFENVISIDRFSNHRTFKKITLNVDPHQWVSVPHMANAFYVVTKNEIVIPAGILQPPFFYAKPLPRSISYGAIGHVLGHELTHGFDTLGRKFNKDGELIAKRSLQPLMRATVISKNKEDQWSKESIEKFQSRTKNLVEQFSEYTIADESSSKHFLHIDGQNTLGENIADAGGVKMAYKAYRNWVDENGEEYVLPDLNKTSDQLFFIGYAQKECHKSTMKALTDAIKDDVHAPSMFRITGTMSNSKEFAEAFKCKKGSTMNPANKNSIW